MINCYFEDGNKAKIGLRHVTVGAIAFNAKNQVLLVKRSANFSRGGKYSVPGGFLERDQNIKDAVIRELKEETGYAGEVVCLFHVNDNPNRPHEDRQNVDFIFLVKLKEGKFKENEEVTSVAFFNENNLPGEEEFAFDHRSAILKFFKYQKDKFTLPLLGVL